MKGNAHILCVFYCCPLQCCIFFGGQGGRIGKWPQVRFELGFWDLWYNALARWATAPHSVCKARISECRWGGLISFFSCLLAHKFHALAVPLSPILCCLGISQSYISQWLLQQGLEMSDSKRRAFYRWYLLERNSPGLSQLSHPSTHAPSRSGWWPIGSCLIHMIEAGLSISSYMEICYDV